MEEEEVTAIDWLENLPLQTLTDELKQDIIEQFEATVDKAFKAGFDSAKMSSYTINGTYQEDLAKYKKTL